jgi:hypothetical protein
MNKLNISDIDIDRVRINITDIDNGLAIKISGDIDMKDPGIILDPLLDKVHTGMITAGNKVIDLDILGLYFLNSSGIKSIAKWIIQLASIPDNKKYRIRIHYNKDITWQVTSIPTLKYLAAGPQPAVEVV